MKIVTTYIYNIYPVQQAEFFEVDPRRQQFAGHLHQPVVVSPKEIFYRQFEDRLRVQVFDQRVERQVDEHRRAAEHRTETLRGQYTDSPISVYDAETKRGVTRKKGILKKKKTPLKI